MLNHKIYINVYLKKINSAVSRA